MGHIKTSASFYSRGIPNNFPVFGAYVLGNYDVVKPYSLYKYKSNYYDFAFQNKNKNNIIKR
jgi:hypothetical protein